LAAIGTGVTLVVVAGHQRSELACQLASGSGQVVRIGRPKANVLRNYVAVTRARPVASPSRYPDDEIGPKWATLKPLPIPRSTHCAKKARLT
jgi:hypothetical protein